jgi:hypothetical protein
MIIVKHIMSSPDLITKASAFDVDNVSYKEPRVNKRGGKNISVLYNGNPLVVQFPLLFTWGANERVDEQSGRVSYDLSLSFNSKDEGNPVGDYYNKLLSLNGKILDDAVSNCKLWFGKSKMSREVAEAMMYPILKFPKDKNTGEPDTSRDATVKLKLPYWDEKFNLQLYDMNKKQIFGQDFETESTVMDVVPKKCHIKGLMQCSGVWFAGGRFGVTWNLIQAQVRAPQCIGTNWMDDSDDDEAVAKIEAKEAAEAAFTVEAAVEQAVDDDDEPPVPKKKKKIVRKKKKASN